MLYKLFLLILITVYIKKKKKNKDTETNKISWMFPCVNCIYHKNNYYEECLSSSFKFKNKFLTSHYKRVFNCDSKDVLTSNKCDFFCIGQAQ